MDFAQLGDVATLHRVVDRPVEAIEAELSDAVVGRPLTLLVPSLASELGEPALDRILDEVAQADYLDRVVLGLDRAGADDVAAAHRLLERLPQEVSLLWHDGPRLREVEAHMAAAGFPPAPAGKGRNVWWCLGFALARPHDQVIACHDADVVGYSRALLARLVAPLLAESSSFSFAKGYYARADSVRFHGRVNRLLVAPLLRCLAARGDATASWLTSFRYPLAGEIALTADAARSLEVAPDWGLEIATLCSVAEAIGPDRVCQVDLADRFDHKHRRLAPDDPSRGLHRMATDVARAILSRADPAAADQTLVAEFATEAARLEQWYAADAAFNGLDHDADHERDAIAMFRDVVSDLVASPDSVPPLTLPAWEHVASVLPDVHDRIVTAVSADASSA